MLRQYLSHFFQRRFDSKQRPLGLAAVGKFKKMGERLAEVVWFWVRKS